jgi:hypothetical protein
VNYLKKKRRITKHKNRDASRIALHLRLPIARKFSRGGCQQYVTSRQRKISLQILLFSGVIFLVSVRYHFSLVLPLLQSYLFNLMKRMNTKAIRGTKASRRSAGTFAYSSRNTKDGPR